MAIVPISHDREFECRAGASELCRNGRRAVLRRQDGTVIRRRYRTVSALRGQNTAVIMRYNYGLLFYLLGGQTTLWNAFGSGARYGRYGR